MTHSWNYWLKPINLNLNLTWKLPNNAAIFKNNCYLIVLFNSLAIITCVWDIFNQFVNHIYHNNMNI